MLPAKIKNCKSSQTVETPENTEEPPQKEYEEIHIQDEVVLKESEYNGKNVIAEEISCYCNLTIQGYNEGKVCRKRQYFFLRSAEIIVKSRQAFGQPRPCQV